MNQLTVFSKEIPSILFIICASRLFEKRIMKEKYILKTAKQITAVVKQGHKKEEVKLIYPKTKNLKKNKVALINLGSTFF